VGWARVTALQYERYRIFKLGPVSGAGSDFLYDGTVYMSADLCKKNRQRYHLAYGNTSSVSLLDFPA
jgi:hypothetical protein